MKEFGYRSLTRGDAITARRRGPPVTLQQEWGLQYKRFATRGFNIAEAIC